MLVLTCIGSRAYYRVPDSALVLYLVGWDEGPLLCAVLVAVVYCPKLAVMNTIMSLCISGYHSLCIIGITCYMLIYIPFIYKLSCVLHRKELWCVSLLYSSTSKVSGVDVLWCQASWCGLFREGGLGIGWCGGGVFMIGGVFVPAFFT